MVFTRRSFLRMGALAAAAPALPALAAGPAALSGQSHLTAWVFSFDGIDGGAINLAAWSGKPVMVVNTASLCGYTPQLTGLQALWSRYKARGLTVIGVPCNDFGGQEPGTAAMIAAVARDDHGVTFPLAAKTAVRGPAAHRFYKWAAAERPAETPQWNFHKYLIGGDGMIAAVFPTGTEPGDPRVIAAVEKQLGAEG